MSELLTVIEGEVIGRVQSERAGRITYIYEPGWLDSAKAHSLSISMPLARIVYAQRVVLPYLWNARHLPADP